jgi:hypothetical protein
MMMLDVVKDNTSYFLDVVPVHICYIIISRLLLLVATLLTIIPYPSRARIYNMGTLNTILYINCMFI